MLLWVLKLGNVCFQHHICMKMSIQWNIRVLQLAQMLNWWAEAPCIRDGGVGYPSRYQWFKYQDGHQYQTKTCWDWSFCLHFICSTDFIFHKFSEKLVIIKSHECKLGLFQTVISCRASSNCYLKIKLTYIQKAKKSIIAILMLVDWLALSGIANWIHAKSY